MRVAAGIVERMVAAALALTAGAAGALIAVHHPISPVIVVALATVWFAFAWRWPQAWLVVVPALLPIADLSPWTGWIAVDEFDILLLVTLAAGHARRAWNRDAASPRTWLAMVGGITLFIVPALWRGLHDAGIGGSVGVAHFGWFDGYADPVNSLRVAKSAVYALALLPLIDGAMRRDPIAAARRLGIGMLAGLIVFTGVVVWERAAYPGLFDTTEPYRTTAAFWEMHVGGAAIDGYLALATPFAAWALWSARGKRRWLVAATLTLLVGYACLTTFSRGVYAAVLAPLLLLGIWLWARRRLSRRRWRTLATCLLIGLIGVETLAVLAPDSFMARRMTRSQRDYVGRLEHWQSGLALQRTTADHWLGIGLGRLPTHYAATARGGEFSGTAHWVPADGHGAVRIYGPPTRESIGGLFGLTQQVPFSPRYRLQLDLRSATGIDLYARICESHLLYDGACQYVYLRWQGDGSGRGDDKRSDGGNANANSHSGGVNNGDRWQHLDTALGGPPFTQRGPWPHRGMVFALSVANPGGSAEFDAVRLRDASGQDVALNGSFDHDLARWWPAAQYHFLPWHIDNLYLELLIERGWLGLTLGVALLAATLYRLLNRPEDRSPLAPFVAAALVGAAIVGAVSSLLDAPRTAFLLALLIAVAWYLPPLQRPVPEPSPMP